MRDADKSIEVAERIIGRHLRESRLLHVQIILGGGFLIFMEPFFNGPLPDVVKVYGFVLFCVMFGICGAISMVALLGKLNNGTPLAERLDERDS
ncbi:MAG: hypothetical protein HRU11_14410 [Parvularculaceae bacterium]|nr:hypothetical protein [Parvularculaceae bacterium]